MAAGHNLWPMYYLMKKYLLNCVLFLLPVMLWDGLFTSRLPAAFQPDVFRSHIPVWLQYAENATRILVFALPLFMPLPINKLHRKAGFKIYLAGLALYFAAWIAQIDYPQSPWSQSLWGFMAPAYTPIIWLAGIALMADSFYCKLPYRRFYYLSVSAVFVVLHCWHTWLVWERVG